MSVSQRLKRDLIIAYLAFSGMAIICFIVKPDIFDHPDYGLSYYADKWPTGLFFNTAIAVMAVCLWRTAGLLKQHDGARAPRFGFLTGALCLVGILLTPMGVNDILWWSHVWIGLALGVAQTIAVAWVLQSTRPKGPDYMLTLLFLMGVAMTVLSTPWIDVLGVYVWGEILIFNANILLLGRAALRTVR